MFRGVPAIVLFCKDTEASRQWYAKLGFEYLRGEHGMHWFSLVNTELMLHPGGTGSAAGQKVVVAAEEIDTLFRTVVAAGLRPVDHLQEGMLLEGPVTRPWGSREFELIDPDGHQWAFTQV